MAEPDDRTYSNIRDPELLGPILQQRLLDVTQNDHEDAAGGNSRVYLHFENGYVVSFPIGDDGFEIQVP